MHENYLSDTTMYDLFSIFQDTIILALVVGSMDNAIHRIKCYSADRVIIFFTLIRWIAIYLLDSVIQPLNNRDQVYFDNNNDNYQHRGCKAYPKACSRRTLPSLK